MTSWIDERAVTSALQDEASKVSVRLGHRMSPWTTAVAQKGLFLSRCLDCGDTATIAVRRLHRVPIAGAAVMLRCRSSAARSPASVAGARRTGR